MLNIQPDAEIDTLIHEAKTVPNGLCPLTKQIERNQHWRRDFDVTSASGNAFVISTRQSMLNVLNFSAILGYRMPGLNTIFRLCRYNGKHEHTNTIEDERFRDFHIHIATERYQRRGSREDHFARMDNRYATLDGAIECLLMDCGFGFDPPAKNLSLFPGL